MNIRHSLHLGWVGCLLVGALGDVACSSDDSSTTTGPGRGGATSTGSGGSAATGGAGGATGGSGATGGIGAAGGSGGASGQGGRGGTSGSAGSSAAGGSGGWGGATGGSGGAIGGSGGKGGAGGTGGAAGTGGTAGAAGNGGNGGTAGKGGATVDSGAPADSGNPIDAGGTLDGSTSCPGGGWAPGDQTIKLQWGGVERSYVVHVPPSYTGTIAVPLMLVIHGAHNTPALARSWSQMDPVSNQNGFIVMYPAGLDCWNAGGVLPGCTAADDDVGFLKAAVSDVKSHACIDPKRVFATGISNGSMMAQHMGCQAADIFASVGGVAAGGGRCTPSRPLSVFYVHGTEDMTVSFSGAQPNVTRWANVNGCNGTPVETYNNQGSTKCVTYQGCRDGVEVTFCTVTGMGHCWPEDTRCGPGGGPQYGVSDFKASPMMWEFFQRHPLP
jgi:polyhydroxybutyrate depolymerase